VIVAPFPQPWLVSSAIYWSDRGPAKAGRYDHRSAEAGRHPLGRSGETGRRAGLKIPFPSGSVGSIPTSGTKNPNKFDDPARPDARAAAGSSPTLTQVSLIRIRLA
jgi:hypothetical protein